MRVCLGGTFHPLHGGHRVLFAKAAEKATQMFIGVTAGELASRRRDMPSVEARIDAVTQAVRGLGYEGDLLVRPLTEPEGPASSEPYDAVVVSPETIRGAEAINRTRAERGLDALQVVVVPHWLGQDLLPVSATRIAAGDIDAEGVRLRPLRVAVGSANPVKVAGVKGEIERITGLDVEVQGHDVASGVPEQPQSHETLAGAKSRAEAAMKAWPEADYAIGVEAGLNQDPEGHGWYDVQACAVLDAGGRWTDGWGPAFQYPEWVTKRALAGEMISDILGPVAEDPAIGGTTGAIGFLTQGRLDRTALTGTAVLMAFVPRIRRDLYDGIC